MGLTSLRAIVIVLVALSLHACGGAEERKQVYLKRGQQLLEQKDYQKAQLEFRNVLQIDPKSAEAWFYQGRCQESLAKPREAVASYNKSLELDPDYAAAKTGLARIYLFAGVSDQALTLSQQVLEKHPQDMEALVVHAGALHRSGQAEQAVNTVRKALAQDADHVGALAMLTRIYLDSSRAAEAEQLLSASLQRRNNDDVRGLLVQLYLDNKQAETAIPHIQILIKNHPDNLDLRHRLAQVHGQSGQISQAEDVLTAAVKDFPDNIAARVFLIRFLAQHRDVSFAQSELEKFIQADPDNADLKLLSAQLHLQNKNVAAAEKIWRDMLVKYDRELPAARARMELIRVMLADPARIQQVQAELAILMQQNPAYNDGLILRGRLAMDAGRYEDAINDFRAVLKDQPNAVAVIKLLSSAFMLTDRPELAEEQLKLALGEAPRDAQIHLQLAQVYQMQKRYDDSTRHLQVAQQLDPESVAASEVLFRNYLARKNYAAADELAAKIIKAQPDTATGYFMRGMLLQAQGREADSIAPLEQALDKSPQATEVLNLLTRAALVTGRVDWISEKLQSIVKANPEHLVALNLLGEIAMKQQRHEQAQKIFGEITQKKPGWWIAWRNLAQSDLALNQTELALASYRHGIDATGDERLVVALALLYEQLQRVDDAVAVYEAALKRAPDSIAVSNNLALLLAEKRDDKASRDRALELVQKFASSQDANSLDTLGWVHYLRGEYDMAITTLMQSDRLSPNLALTQYHLAASYFGKGEHAQARNFLQAALHAEPRMQQHPGVVKLMQALPPAG